MVTSKQFFNLWLTLFAIWLILNGSLNIEVVVSGVLVAALLAYLLGGMGRTWSYITWSPRVVRSYLLYLGVFLQELIKANLYVMKLVFARQINIHPGIVEIKTNLKTPLGRMALANSITLTPGTLVVDIQQDSLFVHWISVGAEDPVTATQAIAGRFEKHLEVIFG